MDNGKSLFATLAAIDPQWADRRVQHGRPARSAGARRRYAAAYRSLRDIWNFGARYVSPMAWNGSNGLVRRAARLQHLHCMAQYAARVSRARLHAGARGPAARRGCCGPSARLCIADGDGWTRRRRRDHARPRLPHAGARCNRPRGAAFARGTSRRRRHARARSCWVLRREPGCAGCAFRDAAARTAAGKRWSTPSARTATDARTRRRASRCCVGPAAAAAAGRSSCASNSRSRPRPRAAWRTLRVLQ